MQTLLDEFRHIVGAAHVFTEGDLTAWEQDWRKRSHGKALQLHLPQSHPRPIAAPTVRRDQQPVHFGIGLFAHSLPPSADAFDGERGGVVIGADIDPPLVSGQIIDPVRIGPAQFRDQKIMDAHFFGLPFGLPFTPAVLEISNQFLLFRVH